MAKTKAKKKPARTAKARLPSSLEAAKKRNELARLNMDTQAREHRIAIRNSYDATETNTRRRKASPETKSEDQIYDQRKRQLGTNIGRDLERNYSSAKGILHQFRMNVVGKLGKLQVNIKGGEEATQWFNEVWAKDCDYRDDLHFSVILQNVVASVIREGDLLALIDDEITEDDSGKLLHWESDQIAPLGEGAIAAGKDIIPFETQENGVLRGEWGKILGWSVTSKHGRGAINDIKDATLFKRGVAIHVKNPWRMNQGRGIPSLITSATNFIDLYEIIAAELQSAKRSAQIAGWTSRKNATTDYDFPGTTNATNLPENTGKSAATTAAEQANSDNPTSPNYERLEAYTGGIWEYVEDGDEIHFADIKRPNVQLAAFVDAVLGHAGASLGVAKAYSLLSANSSYTSFRGDMIMTWVTFYAMQKWLERTYADRVSIKVFKWAMRKKKVKKLPNGWEQTISWTWPVMPHVDELKEAKAEEQFLKNGTLDFSTLLGPNWLERFKAYGKQLEEARKNKLPLSVFEAKSGGAAPSDTDDDKRKNGSDNDDED